MRLSERNLLEMATAYIEDGFLKKWRYDSVHKSHIHHILNCKYRNNQVLSESELDYIKTLDNVILENESAIRFINFSGTASKY